MLNKKFFISLLVLVLAGAGAFWVYNSKKPQKTADEKIEALKVTYAENSEDINLLLDIAEKQGYFKQQDIAIEKIMPGKSTPSKILMAKEADISISTLDSLMAAYQGGGNVQVLGMLSDYPSNYYVVSKYPLDQLSKVKKVASRTGTASHLALQKALANKGLDTSKLEYVPYELSARVALIKSGQVDLSTVSSFGEINALKNTGWYLFKPSEFFGEVYSPRGLAVMTETAASRPAAIEKFAFAFKKSVDYLKNNKDKAINLLVEKNGRLSQTEASSLYDDLIKSMEKTNFIPDAGKIADYGNELAKVTKAKGDRDIRGFVNTDFAQKAENAR